MGTKARYHLTYISNSQIKWYFSEDHKFVKHNQRIMTFNGLQDARTFFMRYARGHTDTFLRNRSIHNFHFEADGKKAQSVYSEKNQMELLNLALKVNPLQQKTKVKTTQDEKPLNPVLSETVNAKVLKKIELRPNLPSTVPEFITYLHENHHILIMDLEFYPDRSSNNTVFHMEQIAGHYFDTVHGFNYMPYAPSTMTPNEQLKFLATSDLPMSLAKQITATEIIKRIEKFIQFYEIDTLLSWDNGQDFKILKQDQQFKPFKTLRQIDLSNIVASELYEDQAHTHIGLKRACRLFNLQHEGEWHTASDDVNMINKLCQRLYQMNKF